MLTEIPCYRSQTKMREYNVFIGICVKGLCGEGVCTWNLGTHLPPPPLDMGPGYLPPCPPLQTGYLPRYWHLVVSTGDLFKRCSLEDLRFCTNSQISFNCITWFLVSPADVLGSNCFHEKKSMFHKRWDLTGTCQFVNRFDNTNRYMWQGRLYS